MKIMLLAVALLAGGAWGAHTGTVEIAATNVVGGVARSVTLAFANHANETNGLWVVYGREDAGETTNGWDVVRFLATVPPEMDSYDYTLPLGWGSETLHAIRFFLSEVPYGDVDCTLSYLYSDMAKNGSTAQGMLLTGFELNGTDRVQTRVSFDTLSPGNAQGVFCARPGNGRVQVAAGAAVGVVGLGAFGGRVPCTVGSADRDPLIFLGGKVWGCVLCRKVLDAGARREGAVRMHARVGFSMKKAR